ncbi:Uncharacterised protein [Pseudomonas aeruginosa]|nr:Uncharacterised protein [Pseudomonas aeruginosa]
MRCGGPALCSECAADASRTRAALAQPSTAQAEQAEVKRLREENANLILTCASLDSEKREMQHKWDAIIAERDAALARVAELERQEPVALANRGLHAFLVKWTEAAAGLYGPGIKLYAAPVAQAQQLNDLDKQCRDDVARALGLRPNQERGFAWSYLLASIKSCVKASEDAAQAQHSVPAYVSYTTRPAESLAGIALRQLKDESRWVEIRDINAHTFPDMQSHSYYPAGTVIKLPAAAPGKEVGHE